MDLVMSKNTGNRHYYAEFCQYGSKVISDGDTLMRFETREERDEIVKRINETNQSTDEKAIAVTLSSVNHRYDVRKFDTDECDEVTVCEPAQAARSSKSATARVSSADGTLPAFPWHETHIQYS